MRIERVIIVVGTVQIGRHHGNEIRSILSVVALAHDNAGDLCNGIRLIRRFKLAGKESILAHRLRTIFGVYAGGPKKKQLLNLIFTGFVDDVHLNLQVAEDEFGRIGIVGVNAADLCRGEEDILRLFIGKEDFDRMLIGKIELTAILEQQIIESLCPEFADKGRADKAVMAGDEDFGSVLHIIPSKGAVFEKINNQIYGDKISCR